MKKLGILSILLLGFSLIAAGTTFGDTLTNTVPAGLVNSGLPISITLDGTWTGTASGTLGTTNVDWYTGYSFHFSYPSSSTTFDELESFCVDPADAITGPMSPYYIETLSGAFQDMPTPTAIPTQYREAAYLLQTYGNTKLAQVAAWEIVFTDYTYNGSDQSTVSDYVTEAKSADLNSVNPADFYMATSPNAYSSPGQQYQDYLFMATPVPEPPSVLLAGFLLLGFAALKRKKRAKELG